ncbi:MAG: sulfotransferase [Cyanobacteria bacterium P01_F01_bin.33]
MMPNFLIVGAAKSGTTSLHYYLNQHPQIFMSRKKEPRFFAPEFYTEYHYDSNQRSLRSVPMSLDEYCALFDEVSDETVVGESSPEYLYFPSSPVLIKRHIPDVKLAVILRDPSERAFSAYCYHVREGRESKTFEQALRDEENKISCCMRPGWFYIDCGFYYMQLKRYFDIFDADQIRIYLHDELLMGADFVCRDIFHFLGVNEHFLPDLTRKNISKIPQFSILNRLGSSRSPAARTLKKWLPRSISQQLSAVKKLNLVDKPALSEATRSYLVQIYREDILKLQDLIQRDLSSWLCISRKTTSKVFSKVSSV